MSGYTGDRPARPAFLATAAQRSPLAGDEPGALDCVARCAAVQTPICGYSKDAAADQLSATRRRRKTTAPRRAQGWRYGQRTESGLTPLEPGMAVTAEIETGQHTAISTLLSPLLRFRQEGLRER